MIWTHQGVTYDIKKSSRRNKKLQATYLNKETKNLNTIHFGQAGSQSYKDCSGLLPKSLIHSDKQRRENYRSRHRNDILDRPSSGNLAWNCLW